MTMLEYGNDIIIITAVCSFEEKCRESITSFRCFLLERKEKRAGHIITHAHYDIGAIPHFAPVLHNPIDLPGTIDPKYYRQAPG